MQNTVTVKPHQSLFDIALQEFGKAEAAIDIANVNGISITEDLYPGQVLELPEFDDADQEVVDYLAAEGIVIATDYDVPGVVEELIVRITDIKNEANGNDGYILIDVSGGTKPYAFEWKDEHGDAISNKQNLTGIPTGIYTVLVTDNAGVSVLLSDIVVGGSSVVTFLVDEEGNSIVDEDGNEIIG